MTDTAGSHRKYAAAFLLVAVALAVGAFFLATRVSVIAGIAAGVIAVAFLLAGLGGLRVR